MKTYIDINKTVQKYYINHTLTFFDNNTYFPRPGGSYTFYINNNPCVINVACFPACCGIGITTIEKIHETCNLSEILQQIIIESGYEALFIKNNSYIIKDMMKNIHAKYIKSLNVYIVCKN